ncbi:MAG: acyclic terpene utilization AtuA family protein, partial [Myxococcota bacterium]
DWDALAGAVVAGHVIECGTQCTGGNYAFFQEIPGLEAPGFPIAELAGDGSSVITKHPGTGGQVSLGTVTAQLLYEISGPRYPNPDVTARFDSIRLESQGPDRVRISAVVGEPPPPDTKVCINYLGGYRNSVTFLLAGLDVEAKARLAERTLCERLGGRERFAEVDVRLLPGAADRAPSAESGLSRLKVTVKDPDPDKVGRAFSNEAVAMTLASYPGFVSTPPSSASSYAVFWPTLVPNAVVEHAVVVKGERVPIAPPPATRPLGPVVPAGPGRPAPAPDTPPRPPRMEALGRVVGARSGDKGGNANVGLWARSAPAFAWLRRFLDVPRFRELIPEARELPVERFELANLWAVNFVVVGLLGEGVASSTREDPQAKALGEILRAQVVPIPVDLLDPASEATVERRSSRQERGAP